MIRKVQIEANACECNICHYQWISIASEVPDTCRNKECRSREWNGKKKRSSARIRLPKPTKIRHEDEEMDF